MANRAHRRRSGTAGPRAVLWIVAAAAIVAASAAGLVAVLAVLHVAAPTRLPQPTLVVPDAELGWRHGAHLRLLMRSEGQAAWVITDARGFRVAAAAAATAAPARRTVAVLGDSFAFAGQVAWADSFPAVAANAAATVCPGPAPRVINTGTVGYGTAQQWLLWRNELAATRPDVVVVAFFVNDLADNAAPGAGQSGPALRGAGRPVLDVDTAGRLRVRIAAEPPPPAAPGWLLDAVAGARLGADRIYGTFSGAGTPRRPEFEATAWRAALRAAFSAATAPARATLAALEAADRGGAAGGISASTAIDVPASLAPQWPATRALLVGLLREIAAADATPVLLAVAHPERVEGGAANVDVPDALLAEAAAAAGARFVPTGDALRAYRTHSDTPLYGAAGRGHWNALGHRVVGRLLAPALCAGG